MSAQEPPRPEQRRVIRLGSRGRRLEYGRPRLPVAVRLIAALALLIAIGTVLLSLPGTSVRRLTFMEALFTATSASTVTGLSVMTTSSDFTLLGQVIILCLVQVGGMGLVIAIVLLLRLFGRRITLVDRLAMTSSVGLDKPQAIVRVVRAALLYMLAVEAVGALLLYLHWRSSAIVPASQVPFYAVFHSVMAFCNAGFDLFAGLPQYPAGIPGDIPTLLIMGVLVIIGGLGLPVYMDLLFRRKRRRMALHTRVTLITSATLVTVGFLALMLSEYGRGGLLHESSVWDSAVRAWFQSVSARTAGFPGFEGFENMRQESRMIIMMLMFIGSAPASMGGGITTGSFAVLGLGLYSFVRGYAKVRVGNRTIGAGSVRRATAILVTGIAAVGVAAWLLLFSHPFTMDAALFEVVSAFSTTGLSLGITGDLNSFGRLVIIVMMFWGRLGAVTVMIALLQRKSPELLVDYPQEDVLVG